MNKYKKKLRVVFSVSPLERIRLFLKGSFFTHTRVRVCVCVCVDCSSNYHFMTYEKRIPILVLYLQAVIVKISCNMSSRVNKATPSLFLFLLFQTLLCMFE